MSGRPNTQFSVAVHVLTYLAGAAGIRPISSDELSGSASVNPVYVRRVLGPLREAGIVVSRPGAQGGWELARPAEEIHLDEIWAITHLDPSLATHHPNPDCPVGRRIASVLDGVEDEVAAATRRQLHGHTVSSVLGAALAAEMAASPHLRAGAVPTA